MEIVIWLIVGLVVGGAIGALATWWISRARGGAVSVMQLKQENDRFKNEVTEHFVETARLINQMTDSYKQVFDHLSSGAEKLVDEKSLAERLPPASGQEVKLKQFGASSASEKTENKAPKSGSGGDGGSGNKAEKVDERSASAASGRVDPLKSRPGASAGAGAGQTGSGKTGTREDAPSDKPRETGGEKRSESADAGRREDASASKADQSPGKSRTSD
ncbi:MAG: hypothetical protein CMP07_12175 [Xanthomonadales bacterium]|nr:hypothetical protein [Xanthomonadales bacterium]|tara:strand:+ start:206 stop:859 length:654 start_codon:yes stop_codon:yes gene_type:complete